MSIGLGWADGRETHLFFHGRDWLNQSIAHHHRVSTTQYDVHNAGPLSAKTVTVDDSANLAGLDIVEGSPVLTFEDLEA